MIGAGQTPPTTGGAPTLIRPTLGNSSPTGVGTFWPAPMGVSTVINPTDKDMQGKLFKWMQDDRTAQYNLAEKSMKTNAYLQAGKLGAETLTKSLDSIFTHVVNMKQMEVYNHYLDNQHDIARRSINLESKKLDVMKEMNNDQLRFQLKVSDNQKQTAVTIAAIQEKGKTKRVEALAALRSVYGFGKPVSPFQRFMT